MRLLVRFDTDVKGQPTELRVFRRTTIGGNGGYGVGDELEKATTTYAGIGVFGDLDTEGMRVAESQERPALGLVRLIQSHHGSTTCDNQGNVSAPYRGFGRGFDLSGVGRVLRAGWSALGAVPSTTGHRLLVGYGVRLEHPACVSATPREGWPVTTAPLGPPRTVRNIIVTILTGRKGKAGAGASGPEPRLPAPPQSPPGAITIGEGSGGKARAELLARDAEFVVLTPPQGEVDDWANCTVVVDSTIVTSRKVGTQHMLASNLATDGEQFSMTVPTVMSTERWALVPAAVAKDPTIRKMLAGMGAYRVPQAVSKNDTVTPENDHRPLLYDPHCLWRVAEARWRPDASARGVGQSSFVLQRRHPSESAYLEMRRHRGWPVCAPERVLLSREAAPRCSACDEYMAQPGVREERCWAGCVGAFYAKNASGDKGEDADAHRDTLVNAKYGVRCPAERVALAVRTPSWPPRPKQSPIGIATAFPDDPRTTTTC